MGMEFTVYIGAYIEIKADLITEKGPMACPDGHGAGSYQFCPQCGKELVRAMITRGAYLWDLLPEREYEDMLYSPEMPGTLIAIGNMIERLPDRIDLPDQGDFIREITNTGENLIANFRTNYAKIIAVLESRAKSVEVKFGAIGYWS